MNLGEIRTAIQDLGYGTDTAPQQTSAINRIQRNICGMNRWPFLEKQDSSLSTATNVPAYNLPMNDWRNLDAVRIEVTAIQEYDLLDYKSPQEFRDFEHSDRDAATPAYWTFINQQLHFWPVPDQAYTVKIDYITICPALVADTDVPIIPVDYHDVLVWGAVQTIAFRERDWLGREFAQGEFESGLKRMQQEYFLRQRQTSSHVRKSGYWSTRVTGCATPCGDR